MSLRREIHIEPHSSQHVIAAVRLTCLCGPHLQHDDTILPLTTILMAQPAVIVTINNLSDLTESSVHNSNGMPRSPLVQ